MKITVTNVNGTMHVHRSGCADLNHLTNEQAEHGWTIDATCVKDIVEDTYGPQAGSFYAENDLPEGDPDNWLTFREEFKIAPCVKLPETVSAQNHNIVRTDRDNGRWSAECTTCGVGLSKLPMRKANLDIRISQHCGAPALSAPEAPDVLAGTRTATVADVADAKGSKTRGVVTSRTEPDRGKVIPIGKPKKVRVSTAGMDNFRYMAAEARTESARRYWSRYLARCIEVA